MKHYLLGLGLLALLSCKNEKAAETVPESNQTNALAYYGDSISTDSALTVDETIQSLAGNDSIMTSVSGYVTSVCQKKGCWMVLSQNPGDTTGLFVKFRDYGFFVPLDFSGSKVVIRGKAFKEITSVDDLKHYAEDEGKSADEIAKITDPLEELKFMADGVALIENPTK
ncbi:MAG: DUF4920 domain-containing protein [Saprospiraceae bacterium]|nr:DUF4920 domain-containing protein [Saprospiraceae bacterium]